jgi:pre-mRNA-processing factor 40
MMNAMNGHFPAPGAVWMEHRTPDGRSYYYNNLTKVTQWTKPEEMMSLAEVCSDNVSMAQHILTFCP